MSMLRSNGIEREIFISRTRFLTNSIILLGTKSAYFPLRLALPFDLSNQTRKVGTFFVMSRANPFKDRKYRDEMFAQGMLWCSKCDQFHPIDDFNKYPSNPGHNYGYRHCCRLIEKLSYLEKKNQRNQRANDRNSILKARFVELAGGACQRCGYSTFNAALGFHHVYASQKEHAPNNVIFSGNFEKTWQELDKCCLLCANCHLAYEAGQWRAEFIKRDGLGWGIGQDLSLKDKRYEVQNPPMFQLASVPIVVDSNSDICPSCNENAKPKVNEVCLKCLAKQSALERARTYAT